MRRKPRHRDYEYFGYSDLEDKFPWVDRIKRHHKFHPAAEEIWNVKILGDIARHPRDREKFEQYVRDFFSKQRKFSIIFCWRHTGVIIIVFK